MRCRWLTLVIVITLVSCLMLFLLLNFTLLLFGFEAQADSTLAGAKLTLRTLCHRLTRCARDIIGDIIMQTLSLDARAFICMTMRITICYIPASVSIIQNEVWPPSALRATSAADVIL